jgi:hypothetical protein
LISAHSVGGLKVDGDIDNENVKNGDDSHEMAAFMRMFMDLVGIFNEDQILGDDSSMPQSGKD